MRFFQSAKYILIGTWLALALTSCNTTKFLNVDQFLLKGNDIKVQGQVKNKRQLKYELSTLYKQKENSKVLLNLFFPREWFYFKTQGPGDTTRFDKWQRRVLGEPPSIYAPSLAQATVESMELLLHRKGYYNAEVFYDDNIKGKKAYVTYFVTPKRQFAIDTVFFSSSDPGIDTILQKIKGQTELKRGRGVEGSLYERERDRITRYLRNNGYAFFYPNFIAPLEADTTLKPQTANLYLDVLPPLDDSTHQVYWVGNITILPEYDPGEGEVNLRDTVINGYLFKAPDSDFLVKPQVIMNAIHLKTGERYSQENFDKTNRQLSVLGIFRFVRLKQVIDSTRQNVLNFRVELTPNYKMELGLNIELNYTNRSTSVTGNNLIGISLSPTLRNRNLLRGAELLATSLLAGVEINPIASSDSTFFNTVDLRLQGDLYLPKFQDYLGLWRKLNRLNLNKKKRLEGRDFYTLIKENAATRISASFGYLEVLDWYRYNLFNASFGYDFQRSNTHRYIINHIGIDYLDPVTQPRFDSLLSLNPFLQRSFGEQLFVSLIFRDFNLVFNSRANQFGESHYIGFKIEMAGAEFWLGNKIYNAFALNPKEVTLGNVRFSQYAKAEFDFRFYKQYNAKQSLATRFNIGIARPFGFTSDVPYVKQFFVGGPNSLRAWAPRGLGPGGYPDSLNIFSENITRLYQTGDLKLEANLEYRFDLFWRLKGALFLDAGNVWTLRRDPDRCGSQFLLGPREFADCNEGPSLNEAFYKQIALGTGFGFRFDFSYFVFRFDIGVKLRYPFLDPRPGALRRGYWENFNEGWGLNDLGFQLGFGFPF